MVRRFAHTYAPPSPGFWIFDRRNALTHERCSGDRPVKSSGSGQRAPSESLRLSRITSHKSLEKRPRTRCPWFTSSSIPA